MTTTNPEVRGHLAYVTYCKRLGYKTVDGRDLPGFRDLDDRVRKAWIDAAKAVWELATTGETII